MPALVIYSNPCNSPCVSSPTFDPTPGSGSVVMNVAGQDSSGNPVSAGTTVFSLGGNSVENPSLVPYNFQIQYGSRRHFRNLDGKFTQAAAVVYAYFCRLICLQWKHNSRHGMRDCYIAREFDGSGTTWAAVSIHYDRHPPEIDRSSSARGCSMAFYPGRRTNLNRTDWRAHLHLFYHVNWRGCGETATTAEPFLRTACGKNS